MNKKNILFYGLIILIPVFVNYGLFSWTAWGLNGNQSDWFTFFGNYLGFIGAIGIAVIQIKKLKERDNEQDIESGRSFIVVNDLRGPLKLKNLITHENSRIIDTPGYIDIQRRIEKDKINHSDVTTTFLNLSQFGNSPVILDCKISVDYKEKNNKQHNIKVNIGVVEQGIEVFIPITPVGAKSGEEIEVAIIEIQYKTLKNETIKYVINHLTNKEYCCTFIGEKEGPMLFEQEITSATWTYPNKLKERAPN